MVTTTFIKGLNMEGKARVLVNKDAEPLLAVIAESLKLGGSITPCLRGVIR